MFIQITLSVVTQSSIYILIIIVSYVYCKQRSSDITRRQQLSFHFPKKSQGKSCYNIKKIHLLSSCNNCKNVSLLPASSASDGA